MRDLCLERCENALNERYERTPPAARAVSGAQTRAPSAISRASWRDARSTSPAPPERVASVRRSGAQRAGEIAALGNRLPPDAWLTSLRADRIALTLEGHGARIGTVGTAIAGLAHLPPYTGVRLLSVREDSARSGVTYAIALDQPR